MPPRLAAFLTWGFVIWLFRRDIRQKPNVSGALWIPLLWLIIDCSRPPAEWLTMFGLPVPGGSSLDGGTPVDALFQFGLLISGLVVLHKRGVTFAEFFRNNIWVGIFLGYCLLSIFWSDCTFVSLKRWIRDLELPVMAMVVLTEGDPLEALTRLIKRCAYVIIPVSILFVKYYPEWDRVYDDWSGFAEHSGVAIDKNFLGLDCLITGYFFVWYLVRVLKVPRPDRDKSWRDELLLCGGFIWMIWWLYIVSNSRTPLVALTVGSAIMLFSGWKRVKKEFMGAYLLTGGLLVWLCQATFGIYGSTLKFLGRNPTLTDRTFLWHDLLNMKINSLIGVGFESFWMGWQMKLPEHWETTLNESHNGYLETYLTLGFVGLGLLFVMLIATYQSACSELLRNLDWGRFRLGYFVAFLIYNWTEVGFRATHPAMQMFYLIALNYPAPQLPVTQPFVEASEVGEEPELANQASG